MTLSERDLEQAARQLGASAAARLDVNRASNAVVQRLRATPVTPWWAAPGLLRAAAVVVLVLGVGLFYRAGNGSHETAPTGSLALQTLSETELEQVLDSLVVETPVNLRDAAVDLSDLDESQLTELLQRMEG